MTVLLSYKISTPEDATLSGDAGLVGVGVGGGHGGGTGTGVSHGPVDRFVHLVSAEAAVASWPASGLVEWPVVRLADRLEGRL